MENDFLEISEILEASLRQSYHEMLPTTMTDRITFAPFNLDLGAERLTRGSLAIPLPPKAFGVLRYLAERPGRLVTKEELLGGIWPNVHVGPDVLKVTVAEIRKALDDPFRKPRFIETAHRRGYRFIADTNRTAVDLSPVLEMPTTHYARSGD